MQGRQRQQIRAAGALLEKLATLTRAESRVAYQWMNADDPQSSDYFLDQLPPESIKTLAEVEKMIDDLSKEAVRLGQLDPEAFKRNRFAYLRRSYVKHTADLTKFRCWRKVVQAVRNWLQKAGAKSLAKRLDTWPQSG
jgi:hypothetical protein